MRLRVRRAKFGDTDPKNATIGHKTRGGWELLDTRIVSITERTVTLEARTRGFSPFAVFANNEVRYEWTLPDGTRYLGREVRSQFDEPGLYNVSLTVTDSFGRSNTATYRVLVNDPPTVEIEGIENATVGEPTELRANVTNEFGNATVTWVFADGTTLVGESVAYTFEPGETLVRARVEDAFGANGTDEETVILGSGEESEPPSIGVIQFNLGLGSRIAIVGFAAIALLSLLRWLAARRYRRRGWSS